jgi:hypothetical protein
MSLLYNATLAGAQYALAAAPMLIPILISNNLIQRGVDLKSSNPVLTHLGAWLHHMSPYKYLDLSAGGDMRSLSAVMHIMPSSVLQSADLKISVLLQLVHSPHTMPHGKAQAATLMVHNLQEIVESYYDRAVSLTDQIPDVMISECMKHAIAITQ